MIEVIIKTYLSTELSDPVYMEVPHNAPAKYYVLEKTGGTQINHIYESTFALQAYASSMQEAATMMNTANEVMEGLISDKDVCRVLLNSSYNYTDTSKKGYRYQSIFVITHYKEV